MRRSKNCGATIDEKVDKQKNKWIEDGAQKRCGKSSRLTAPGLLTSACAAIRSSTQSGSLSTRSRGSLNCRRGYMSHTLSKSGVFPSYEPGQRARQHHKHNHSLDQNTATLLR